MPGGSAAYPAPYLAERYVQFIVHDNDVFGCDFVKVANSLYRFTAVVHVGLGFGQNDPGVAEGFLCDEGFQIFFVHPGVKLVTFGEGVNALATDVMQRSEEHTSELQSLMR